MAKNNYKKPTKAGPRPEPVDQRVSIMGKKLPKGIIERVQRPKKKGENEIEYMVNTGKEGISKAYKDAKKALGFSDSAMTKAVKAGKQVMSEGKKLGGKRLRGEFPSD